LPVGTNFLVARLRQQTRRLALGNQLARTLLGTQMQPLMCATYAFSQRPLSRASRLFVGDLEGQQRVDSAV
jgi:hypothetical protein